MTAGDAGSSILHGCEMGTDWRRVATLICLSCAGFVASCSSNANTTPVANPAVTISGASQARLGSTVQFTASVTNTSNTAVSWQVNGVAGGSSTAGTVSAAGLYTPP